MQPQEPADVVPAPAMDKGFVMWIELSPEALSLLAVMRQYKQPGTGKIIGYEGLGMQMICPVIVQEDFYYNCRGTKRNISVWYPLLRYSIQYNPRPVHAPPTHTHTQIETLSRYRVCSSNLFVPIL